MEELNTDTNFGSSWEGHIVQSDPGNQSLLLYPPCNVTSGMDVSEGSVPLKWATKACSFELEVCPLVGTEKFFCTLQQ